MGSDQLALDIQQSTAQYGHRWHYTCCITLLQTLPKMGVLPEGVLQRQYSKAFVINLLVTRESAMLNGGPKIPIVDG